MVVRVVAGVDVGNATTEVVLVRRNGDPEGDPAGDPADDPAGTATQGREPPRPLAWDRAPTRGRKGSVQAAEGAASLVRRVAARAGLELSEVVLAPQRPVDTSVAVLPRVVGPTGRLRLLAPGSTTPGAPGVGVGRPVVLDDGPPPDGPLVVLVPAGAGYAQTAQRLRRWLGTDATGGGRSRAGDVRAVLLADDEGVLVARRAGLIGAGQIGAGLIGAGQVDARRGTAGLPVLDRVDVDAARVAVLLAVEVCAPGTPSTQLADPVRLGALLALEPGDARDAAAVAREVADAHSAVVALLDPARVPARPAAPSAPAGAPAGTPAAHPFAGAAMDDVWQVDLDDLAARVELPRRPGHRFGSVLAGLREQPPASAAQLEQTIAAVLGVPVSTVGSEAAAARAGALTTPGASRHAIVLDLGGGTLDAVAPDGRHTSVAGGGELVGAAVAAMLGIPRGAAEWVKRGPCGRLESAQVMLGEDGVRSFLDTAGPSAATGSLVVPGPAGWLAFSRDLAPAQWRAARLALKREALGANVSRTLHRLTTQAPASGDAGACAQVLLVGGVAEDGELLRSLHAAVDAVLPGALVGRGDVGSRQGALGHRWAVAYGLTLLRG